MKDNLGKKQTVLLTDGYGEILEIKKQKKAEKWAHILAENSDCGWEYKIQKIENKK